MNVSSSHNPSFNPTIAANPNVYPLVHTDGSYQYTTPTFIDTLNEQNMAQSVSRVHCCKDNGPMEGFWAYLNVKCITESTMTPKKN